MAAFTDFPFGSIATDVGCTGDVRFSREQPNCGNRRMEAMGYARDSTETECDPMTSYPSNASPDPRLVRDSSASSGSGNGLPVSRNLLVMG